MPTEQRDTRKLEFALRIAAAGNAALGAFFAYRGLTIDGVFLALSALLFVGCAAIFLAAEAMKKTRLAAQVTPDRQAPS